MEVTEDFKRQFKAAVIAALKQGFTPEEIRKNLKEQGYSPQLIEKLLAELQTDPEIIAIVTRKQKIQQLKEKIPVIKEKTTSITEKVIETIDEKIMELKRKIKARKEAKPEKIEKPRLRKIVFKVPKIKEKLRFPKIKIPKISIPKIRIPKIKKKPSLIKKIKPKISEKERLKLYNLYYNLLIYEKQRLKEKSKDKKYTKSQKNWIKLLLKYIKKTKPLATPEINKFILTEEKDLNNELKLLKENKITTYIKKLKSKQVSLQKTINKIKSAKFKKAISQI